MSRRQPPLPFLLALAPALLGCGGGAAGAQSAGGPAPTRAAADAIQDTTGEALVPPGYGTLRQDDIAVRVQLVGGLTVRAIPLEEGLIRLLSPDSYRAMRQLVDDRRADIEAVHRRVRLPRYSLWYVSFFGQEQGEARFSPQEVIITNSGRDFRPLEVVPLTPGFGEQRLRQREVQSAIYLFDGALDVQQPLTVRVENAENAGWASNLQRIERERALVRSRAGRAGTP